MNTYDKENSSLRPLLAEYKNVEDYVKTVSSHDVNH